MYSSAAALVKGPNLFKCYFGRRSQATQECFDDEGCSPDGVCSPRLRPSLFSELGAVL